MKRLLYILLLLMNVSLSGQKISYNLGILTTEDSEIIEIKEFWNSYIKNCIMSFIKKDRDLILKYWNDEELKEGYSDIVMDILSPNTPFYLCGELITFDIKKIDNGFFNIRSLVLVSDSTSKSVLGIFSIYAKKESNGYKLYNSFYIAKSQLKHYSTQHFEYYYPLDYEFSIEKVSEAESFYSMFSTLYDFQSTNKITYIVGKTDDEVNSIIGFDFSVMTGSSKDMGYYLCNHNILVSCQVNHYHEIVHLIISSKFPNVPNLFAEGIATYYGGAKGEKFDFHVKLMQEIINSDPACDLSNFDKWRMVNIENRTDPFYTIGAAFIEYALRVGGPEKVGDLLKYSSSNEDIYSAISNVLGIDKDKINSFLKYYFLNYGKETKVN
jgi:hypothetical protein